MAVDTALKRFSMMDFDVPSAPALFPTGADTFGERLHGLWLYAGIEPDGAPPEEAVLYDYLVRARRRGRR